MSSKLIYTEMIITESKIQSINDRIKKIYPKFLLKNPDILERNSYFVISNSPFHVMPVGLAIPMYSIDIKTFDITNYTHIRLLQYEFHGKDKCRLAAFITSTRVKVTDGIIEQIFTNLALYPQPIVAEYVNQEGL